MKTTIRTYLTYFFILAVLCACQNDSEQPSSGSGFYETSPAIATELSNQRVMDFAEDANGYIWIATFRGLNRYNGHDYHQYYCNDDSLSLPDNQVNTVFCDSKDRLWIATVNGACRYTEQDNFHHVRMIEGSNKNGYQFVENHQGKIFINLVNSFAVYDEQNDCFTHEVKRHDPMDLYTQRLYVDQKDNLWVVNGWKIRSYNSNTLEPKDSVELDQFMGLSCMMGDEIWMANNADFKIYSTSKKQFVPVPDAIRNHSLLQKTVVNYLHPSHDMLTICTRDGIFLYNLKTQTLSHQSDIGFPVKEDEFIANKAFTDSHHNLWLGSQNQGMVIRYTGLQTFNANSLLSVLMQNKGVSSVIVDKDENLWLTTDRDGVFHYNTKTHNIEQFNLKDYSFNGFAGNYDAYCIYQDREGYLWMCIGAGQIAKFQYQDGKLSLLKSYGAFMPLTLYQDKNGTMWAGTYSDLLYTLPKGADEFQVQRVQSTDFSYTSVIKELNDGSPVALSWATGLQNLNIEDRKLEKAPVNAEDMQLSVKRSVFLPTSLLQDKKGRIWIGTVANGLLCYNPDSKHINSVMGVPCTDICSLEEDDEGNIWVSTMNGLSKYDPETQTFSNYDATDGLGGNQFYDRSSCKLSDGTLIFGGTHGITVFNPKDTKQKLNLPLHFEDLKVHNVLIHPSEDGEFSKSLVFNPEIHLSHTQNGFAISFAALDYSQNGQLHYHYQMEGVDKYWVDAKNNRDAYYANVPAGCYTFKVKATNNDGSIVQGENAIKIKVSPAPWATWWAKLLYLALLIGLVYILLQDYLHIQAEKQKTLQAERDRLQEQHVNQMNMSFFANISHEFRTPLTIISGPIEQLCSDASITGENKHLLYIVQRSTKRMLRLVNQMMDFHKLENDTLKLEVKNQDIISLLQQFTDVFTINAKEKDITLNVYGLEDKFMMWLDADKVEKITTNLLSNAFKFTPAGGKITFSFDVISRQEAATQYPLSDKDTDQQYVKISVKDSGKGIPEDQLEKVFERYYQLDNQQQGNYHWGTGIGLYYARNLALLHHGYIKAENRQDQQTGAIFSFILPATGTCYTQEEKSYEQATQNVLFPLQGPDSEELPEDEPDGRKRILVVDDDVEVAHYLKALLAGDYHILTRFDAESGIKAMQEEAPDLVISDVIMPGVNGYDFCKQIKDNLQLCHIPVILVTAQTTTENQVKGLNSGADAYVIKPFDPSYLKALIHSLLQNREKAQHILAQSTQADEVPEEVLTPQDKTFMTELYNIMEKELNNPDLDVTYMTEVMRISRTKLYYKIKGLTGENPSVFFKHYKLNRAAELIREGKYTLSEIADMTGFNTLSHFSTSFKKQFGVSPSEYK